MDKRYFVGLGPLILAISISSSTVWAEDTAPTHSGDAPSSSVTNGALDDLIDDSAASTSVSPNNVGTRPPSTDSDAVPDVRGTVELKPLRDAETRNSNRVIEEIVVTAQKREEKLQDVPISIQAFSGDALAARGIENTTQLGQSVPSLNFTSAVGFTLIYMRGIGTDNFIPSADPSIATYIDGIYVPQGQSTAQSLGNVERVEVLKGPQGTLFGRNATGGAISIVTAEPGDVFKASAEGELGNFQNRSVKASISGPITKWLSASFSGLDQRKSSLYSDSFYTTEPDKLQAGRLKINVHPSDTLSLSLTAFQTKQQGLGSLIGKNIKPSLLGIAVGIPAAPDDYKSMEDLHASSKADQQIYYGNLTWKSPWFDIKLLASHQNIHTGFASSDFDGSFLPTAAFEADNEYSRLFTGELQMVSNDNTWGSDRFKWVTGLYYLRSDAGFDPGRLRVAPQALTTALNIVGGELGVPLTLPSGLQSMLALLPNTPLNDNGLAIVIQGLLGTQSYSGFAQGTYSFNDWLDLTLGGRYQQERRYLTKAQTGVSNPTGNEIIDLPPFPLQSATAKTFSPKGVLSLKPRDNALVYASYSVGYKSGTYNIVNIYTPPNYIEPEKVTTYELGAKMDFLGGLVRVNGALFHNDIKNLQSGFVAILSGGAVRFQTAGSARTVGAEVDGTWIPLPDLDSGLALTGNAAYVHAIYTDFKNGSGFDPQTGLYTQNNDFGGNKIPRAPDFSGGLGFVQSINEANGSYEFAVDEYYNSGFNYDSGNSVKQGPYAIFNAHASYLRTPWNLRVTTYTKNLLDRRYHLQEFQTDFGVISTLAPPREYGLRLNWEF